jgi:hypothetical protein
VKPIIGFFNRLLQMTGHQGPPSLDSFLHQDARQSRDWLKLEKLKIAASTDILALREWMRGRNGFLREAALCRVAALPAKSLWTDVIERCNDWVPEIRHLAGETVRVWLHDEPVKGLIALLPAFGRLRIQQRSDHSALMAVVEGWISRPEHVEVLARTVTHHANPHVVRYAYELLGRTMEDRQRLADLGVHSADVVTQQRAIRLIDDFQVPVQRAYAEKFLLSRPAFLRWHGLKILKSIDPASALERSHLYLLSSHVFLREAAIALCALSKADFQALIVERIQSAGIKFSELSVGLHLLSSPGNKAHTELVSQYLDHAQAQVAGAALVGMARLAPERIEVRLLSLLTHTDPILAQAALRACQIADLRPSPAEWAALTAATRTLAQAQRILTLAKRVDKWTHLCVLLELAKMDGLTLDLCRAHLQHWQAHFNGSYAPINSWQLQSIRSNLGVAQRVGITQEALNFYLN